MSSNSNSTTTTTNTNTSNATSNIKNVLNNEKTKIQNVGNPNSILGFIKNLFIVTLSVLIVIILGSFTVFSCKVAQSNVLPTDKNCFPYTTAVPNVEEIMINVNDHFIGGKNLSQKVKFPYDKNSSNFMLNSLRKFKLSPNASGTFNYFIAILEGLFAFNYSAYNFLFDSLNYLPEILVLIIGPFITILFSTILSLVDHFYLAYLWFSNFSWFFQENENKSGTGNPIWRSISIFEPLNYSVSVMLSILFFVLFFVAFVSFFPILTAVVIILCFITIISSSGLINNNNVYNIFTCMKDCLKYNKKGIMIILSISILLLTFNYFGAVLSLLCLLIILLAFFNIIPISIFSSSLPPYLSELVSDKQASKKCNYEKATNKNNNSSNNNTNNNTNNNKNNNTNKSNKNILQKIGGFLPKFPQIFPSLNVVETYDTPLPSVPYPKVDIGNLQLPNVKLPEEVEIKFPDIKLPDVPQIQVPTAVTDAVENVQDKTIKGLNNIGDRIKGKGNSNNNNSTPTTITVK